MPKKRNQSYFNKPPTSVHPSISSHQYDSHHDAESDKSVNDLLQQLRIDQASSAASTEPRPDVNPQTVHPSLKHILQIPETPPPRPRPGSRAMATHGRRRPPGPPPPPSWLETSIQTPVRSSQSHSSISQQRPSLEKLCTLPGLHLPHPASLRHRALVSIARNWQFHLHYDRYYLPLLPIRYKELLLTYIAAYSPNGVTAQGISLLFANDSIIEDATGTDGLTRLDLSVSIGRSTYLKDLKSFIATTFPTPTKTADTTPESWDIPTSLSPPPTNCTLTHLSLSYPPPSISWRFLLHLSPHLNTLTHLSLSHWPAPTLTPNSTTAYLSTPRGDIDYGDHNLYSLSLDNDFSAPANVLRLLSRDTYCLQYLDLTGCAFWLAALGYRDDKGAGIDWAGAWSGVTIVVVSQGWMPACLASAEAEPGWKDVLRCKDGDSGMVKERRELLRWVATERHSEEVLKRILEGNGKSTRREDGGDGGEWDEWVAPSRVMEYQDHSRAMTDGTMPSTDSSKRDRISKRKLTFEKGWEGWWIEDCIRACGSR